VLNLLQQCSRRTGVKGYVHFWTPRSTDIEQLERLLPSFLSSHDARPPQPLRAYYRQYAGYIAGGHRFIYANFLPEGIVADESIANELGRWKIDPMVVCDGGPDLWGLSFDVDARTFSGLDFNGP
jgi:hypothetical protein